MTRERAQMYGTLYIGAAIDLPLAAFMHQFWGWGVVVACAVASLILGLASLAWGVWLEGRAW